MVDYVIKCYVNDFGRIIEERTWKPYIRKIHYLGWIVCKNKNDMLTLAICFDWEDAVRIALDRPHKEFVDPEWDIRV